MQTCTHRFAGNTHALEHKNHRKRQDFSAAIKLRMEVECFWQGTAVLLGKRKRVSGIR